MLRTANTVPCCIPRYWSRDLLLALLHESQRESMGRELRLTSDTIEDLSGKQKRGSKQRG